MHDLQEDTSYRRARLALNVPVVVKLRVFRLVRPYAAYGGTRLLQE